MAGSGVADILCPKPAVYTRDHAAENRRALRELEAAAVSRRHATEAAIAAAAEPMAPTRGKFQHVESKLASAGLGRKMSPVKSRAPGGGSPGSQGDGAPAGKPFLRAKSREATLPPAQILAPFVRAIVERKAAVPKIAELRRPAVRRGIGEHFVCGPTSSASPPPPPVPSSLLARAIFVDGPKHVPVKEFYCREHGCGPDICGVIEAGTQSGPKRANPKICRLRCCARVPRGAQGALGRRG